MFRKHCSDELLLSHVDKELAAWTRMRVSAHLASCWSCRTRQAELEEQARVVSRAFQEQQRDVSTSLWAADSIRRFRQRRTAFEMGQVRAQSLASRRAWAIGLAGAAVLAVVLGVTPRLTKSKQKQVLPEPARVIATAAAAEAALTGETIHQSFRVEMTQTRPTVLRSAGRLEIWSDTGETRFACRWQARDRLVYAAWRNGAGRRFVHNPSGGVVRNASFILADAVADAAGQRDLETAFLSWLASRQWEPVLLAKDLAVIASRDGVAVRAEALRDPYGVERIRLTGRRELDGRALEFVFEVDAATHRPVLQRLRYISSGREGEIAVIAERVEVFDRREVPVSLFEPDPRLVPVSRTAPVPRPLAPRLPIVATAVVDRDELLEREVEVHLALHRAGACLGEQIEVAVSPGGRVLVQGVAESERRKRELKRALGELLYVDVDLETAPAAAAAESVPDKPEGAREPGAVVPAGRLPIQDELEEHFGKLGERSQVPARIAALANQATSISSALTADAWALKRLASDFPPEKQRRFRTGSRFIVENMAREHVSAIQQRAGRAAALLAPPLASERVPESLLPDPAAAGWRQAVEELLAETERIDRITRALFTGCGDCVEDSASGRDLLSALAEVRQKALHFDQMLAASGLPERPESHTIRPGEAQAARKDGEKP